MFFACGIWRVVDVSSVSPSSEQIEGLWGNQFCHWLKLVVSNWSKICLKLIKYE